METEKVVSKLQNGILLAEWMTNQKLKYGAPDLRFRLPASIGPNPALAEFIYLELIEIKSTEPKNILTTNYTRFDLKF